MLFFPSYKPPFLRDLEYVLMFYPLFPMFFPLQRWDVPAGKQSGPAELYPEVELAPWWRIQCGGKGTWRFWEEADIMDIHKPM